MQPSNTTELQAVNTMLSTIGEAPVDSLTGATSSDAALADQVLTEVVRETLVQGWYFNIDKNLLALPGRLRQHLPPDQHRPRRD